MECVFKIHSKKRLDFTRNKCKEQKKKKVVKNENQSKSNQCEVHVYNPVLHFSIVTINFFIYIEIA